MPGCAAVGCNNRSEKGFIMKCFPRDPKLRKIWQDRVARADWEPSNNSFLCHVHFEPEEWSITQNGRIRLKKNAIPSIFTVTSTRKSPKKRIKLTNVKNENECENDYMTESLENDTEHSSTGHLEEKDSDSQDVDSPSIRTVVCQQANHSPIKIESKQASYGQYVDITNDLQQENIIIISDDNNMKMENNTKENDTEKQVSMGSKKFISNFIAKRNLIGNPSKDVAVKTEIKRDINQIFDDSYDEIEEKLKQICDGHLEENNMSNTEEVNSISRDRKGTLEKPIIQMPFHKSINYKYSPRNKIGDMLADNRDNIEIIFGSESGEELARVPRYTFYNSGTNNGDKLDQHTTNIDSINNKEIDEASEYLEEAFSIEDVHTANNMKAAVKCKRKTREEVMKSIKRSVQDASFQDTNSVSNSDTSDIVEVEDEVKKELNISEITQYNKDDVILDTTKFTVKVIGDREDVFDIMQDLYKDTRDFTIQEHNNTCLQQKNNASVTSIITIDDCPIETNSIDKCINDIFSPSDTSIVPKDNDQVSFALSTLKNNECLTTRLLSSYVDEEKALDINNAVDSVTEQSTTNICTNKCEYEILQRKVKLQETVIKQLTNQLILLKDLEKNLQNKNLVLKTRTKKIEKKVNELNKSTDGISSSTNLNKQTDMRQRLIYDLSNRMSNLEETNKKLMKTITIECQQKRQLESQIKQRDKRIKELNWKLEKASKYLERAEKNTNTYKRKMLNMQTFMRRKKILDRNTCLGQDTSKFHEIMIDSMRENYSERVLAMAMEIEEICGTNGYKKLLNYGFPLPPVSVLQAPPSDSISDSSKTDNKIRQAISSKQNTNEERDTQSVENDVEINTKYYRDENATSFCEEIVMDNTETVTGTVQDIFEESNDDVDDFSTNELKEHFILQLNAVI